MKFIKENWLMLALIAAVIFVIFTAPGKQVFHKVKSWIGL